jgi:hypothetical protein
MIVFGLAGVAGADAAEGLGLLFLGLIFSFLLAFFGVFLKWSVLSLLSVLCHAAVTFWSRPWEAFSPEPSTNWEVLDLQADDRRLAWWWVGVSVAVLTACLDAIRRYRKASAPRGPV